MGFEEAFAILDELNVLTEGICSLSTASVTNLLSMFPVPKVGLAMKN